MTEHVIYTIKYAIISIMSSKFISYQYFTDTFFNNSITTLMGIFFEDHASIFQAIFESNNRSFCNKWRKLSIGHECKFAARAEGHILRL